MVESGRGRAGGTGGTGASTFYILIHQLPPEPLYLRAKIRNRLAKVGALGLKNSVYVLPGRDDCLEDLQWIAQEAVAGGGEAYVCRADFAFGITNQALVERFRVQASAAYEALKIEVTKALDDARGAGDKRPPKEGAPGALLRLKGRFDEIREIDFFDAPTLKEAEAMLRSLETQLHRGERTASPKAGRGRLDLVGRTWVTRRDPHVDRLASAWLIRRFVDPGARFRFIDPQRGEKGPKEIGFDLMGGEFTHEGDRCTFETLLFRLGIADPALTAVAEIVHDIDLKDGRYGRPDAPGIQQVIQGLVRAHADDKERLARALAFFDDLYASFRGRPTAAPRGRARARARRRRGSKAKPRPRGDGR